MKKIIIVLIVIVGISAGLFYVINSKKLIIETGQEVQKYTNSEYSFSIEYPKNFTEFGNVTSPSNEAKKLISLGDPDARMQESDKPWDGFTIFIDPNSAGLSFEEYILFQEKRLPTIRMDFDLDGPWDTTNAEKISFTADGRDGVILKEYGEPNKIYAFIPMSDRKEILVIVMLEEKKGSFEDKFMDIIKSVKFTN